jgi:hypothetical protein
MKLNVDFECSIGRDTDGKDHGVVVLSWDVAGVTE